MNFMSWADSMIFDAMTSSRFSESVVDVIGSASAPLSSGKRSGHNFSPVVRLTSSEPVTPGMMMIGGLPVRLATMGAGKIAGRFGLLALSKHAFVAMSANGRRIRSLRRGRRKWRRGDRATGRHFIFAPSPGRHVATSFPLSVPYSLFKAFVERLFAGSLAGR